MALEALLSADLLLPGVLAIIAAAAAIVLLYKVLPPPAPSAPRRERQLASGKNNGDDNDDDDDEATKTRLGLESEIDALRRERKAVPLNSAAASARATMTHAESKVMAEQLRTIADKIEERELRLEEMRVANVLTEFRDSHPAAMGDCPVCFDPLGDFGRMTGLFCCGAKLCSGCHRKVTKPNQHGSGSRKKKQHGNCPLCRARLPRTLEEQFRTVKEHAENGRSWAQSGLGYHYEFGTGTSVDLDEAKRWYHRAADEQRNPDAMYHLGRLLYEKEQSYKKAREYLIAASDLGHTSPHGILGDMCRRALGGVRKDMVEANRYFTLTVACNPESPDALLHLGVTFSDGDGWCEKSLVRAKHYLERAAESKNHGGGACILLGTVLVELGRERYNGGCVLGGHNSTPRALYYLRKAVAADDEGSYAAAANAEHLEDQMKTFCHGCMKESECCPRELKRCTKCRAVWYCTRDCQLKHWRDGHKADCVRSS